MKALRGTGVALVTPFKEDKSVDYDALERLVNYCIDGGVDYLVVMGTTGENPTLDSLEKANVLEHVKDANAGRLPIVYGIGGNDTHAVLKEIGQANLKGVSAILSASPYYNKPTQEGIYQHYRNLLKGSDLPIILYNVPGRTASNISADTVLRLAIDFKDIIGVKEASGDLEQVMDIINQKPDDFLVISGDDNLTLPMIALGGDGVISVSGQGFPKLFSKMVKDALEGNIEAARTGHYELFDITRMLFEEGNPGGIKAALAAKGICEPHLRLPLWDISRKLNRRIESEIESRGLA
jgi:4-hydroxy-tetrahydrodipicolinate synthase